MRGPTSIRSAARSITCLAGKATYDGETLMAKLIAHREAEIPSLSDVQEGVPDDVQAIFARMVPKKSKPATSR